MTVWHTLQGESDISYNRKTIAATFTGSSTEIHVRDWLTGPWWEGEERPDSIRDSDSRNLSHENLIDSLTQCSKFASPWEPPQQGLSRSARTPPIEGTPPSPSGNPFGLWTQELLAPRRRRTLPTLQWPTRAHRCTGNAETYNDSAKPTINEHDSKDGSAK